MKTINRKYTTKKDLKHFIKELDIADNKNILLQIFTGVLDIDFIKNLISDIKELIPHINIIGSTTCGEIIDDEVSDNSTILSFSIFESTTISTYSVKSNKNSSITAKNLISQFDTQRKAKVAITFTDGLNTNGEKFINAFYSYDKELVVAGGLAGDNARFQQTIVFTQDKILTNGAVVALLHNDNLYVETNASFGWENIGKTMTVTKSINNIVYEIDGIKAKEIYARYLGRDIAQMLPTTGIEFPLIIKKENIDIPRAVVGKNDDGSLVFAGNLKVGDKVTFGYGNIDSILNYNYNKSEKDENCTESIFVYSCMARKTLMGRTIQHEIAPLNEIAPVSGFFTYGEYYTNKNMNTHELLNQTMTILSLSESCSVKSSQRESKKYNNKRSANQTLQALSHLVMQTSKELEDINNNLEEKVELAIQKSQEQSRLAQMGEMMSMIAHQWRQPLSAISSAGSAINSKARMGRLKPEQVVELSKDIIDYSLHLSETINDFRDFFKTNKQEEEMCYCDIVKSSLNIIGVAIANKNIEIIKELNCKEKIISLPNEIRQVVLNLIKNAEDVLIEKNIAKPFIKIKTYKADSDIILEISDNAGGIPKNIINKVFDPYFSTKTKKDGTGLGLYMSKTIIEEHCGGKLSVSNNIDGAVFTVKLPIANKEDN